MTQLVIQHYARPTARRHLWIGLAMAVVALAFGIEQGLTWFAGFETLTLLQAGIGSMVFGCFCLLLRLTDDAKKAAGG